MTRYLSVLILVLVCFTKAIAIPYEIRSIKNEHIISFYIDDIKDKEFSSTKKFSVFHKIFRKKVKSTEPSTFKLSAFFEFYKLYAKSSGKKEIPINLFAKHPCPYGKRAPPEIA